MIEAPQSFVVREESAKAAWQNGFRRPLGEDAGWAMFGSTTARGTIGIAADGTSGAWYLSIDHSGVIEEFDQPGVEMAGPGLRRYSFESLGELYAALPRVYQLAASLPDAPLNEFKAKTRDLPTTTETERLIVQRIGQDIFRERLVEYWQGQCPLTGISDLALLRASHIVPWKDCTTDVERLDIHNGLLLSALWDAAFDRGLVSFGNDGNPIFSDRLSETARNELQFVKPLRLTRKHHERLAWHRNHILE
ncbi:HNH endonuclease [Hyphococcus sp.]|uniref:HNH endonuclease n=1 Tax=Hyphococcus sp. TaxID=2038636 RepID=UPI0035C743E7